MGPARRPAEHHRKVERLATHGHPQGRGATDDVGLHVLGCRVDILGTNCTKLLKVKMSGGSLWLQYV